MLFVGTLDADNARERVQGGLEPASLDAEHALAEAVMAALFGLGRLQPLVDDVLECRGLQAAVRLLQLANPDLAQRERSGMVTLDAENACGGPAEFWIARH